MVKNRIYPYIHKRISVKKDILEYIKKNSNADKKDIKLVDNFLNTQTEWESDKNSR